MGKIPIVFFGTGPVAAESLKLLATEFEVVAVVTKPKPEQHHGGFPVVDMSEALRLPIYYVSNKYDLSELIRSRPFHTEVGILIDFGIIITQDVIDYFPKGIINSHFSLLPEWRGADPISFAILSGQPKTGVSLMLIDEGMDTGKIIRQKSIVISRNSTVPSLTDELIQLSDQMLKSNVAPYLAGKLPARAQPHPDRATYSRKLTKEDGEIDWQKPAEVLEREVRAFIDWPKSYGKLANIDVIITSVSLANNSGVPGSIEIKDKHLIVNCGTGALLIKRLKPAGKSEMSTESFLAGYGNKL